MKSISSCTIMEDRKENPFGTTREDTLIGKIERHEDGNITFQMDHENSKTTSEFLKYKPSVDCRKLVPRRNNPYADQQEIENLPNAGVSYIWVYNDILPIVEFDHLAMKQEWEAVKRRNYPITQSTIAAIADRHSCKSGKWFFHPEDGDEVGRAWELVIKGITTGELGPLVRRAYVHACKDTSENTVTTYVINIRNDDYTDVQQMNSIVKFLRNAGIMHALRYKLDAFTEMQIFPKNPYALRPSIYHNFMNPDFNENIVAYVYHETQQETENTAFIVDTNKGNLSVNEWLLQYSPSEYFTRNFKGNVFGSIKLQNRNINDVKDDNGEDAAYYQNARHAQQFWKKFIASEEKIDYQNICDIAKKYDITYGKWFFYVDTEHVDSFWTLVVKGITNGKLGKVAISAEVSSCNVVKAHLISVNHTDFINKEEVYMLENLLREAGVKCTMMYQPDIYSYLGIRTRRAYSLNPTVYQSYYGALSHKSQIRSFV